MLLQKAADAAGTGEDDIVIRSAAGRRQQRLCAFRLCAAGTVYSAVIIYNFLIFEAVCQQWISFCRPQDQNFFLRLDRTCQGLRQSFRGELLRDQVGIQPRAFQFPRRAPSDTGDLHAGKAAQVLPSSVHFL